MIRRCFLFTLLLCGLALAGCSNLPFQFGNDQPTSAVTPGAGLSTVQVPLTFPGTATPGAPGGTEVVPPTAGAGTLRIWLPPEFDPAGGSPASQLLKNRLEKFVSQNPGLELDVRVKAADGAGGLLDALISANAAAPLALPDLVLLPRPLLESAALKGLLHPYEGYSSFMDDPSWFDYARQLAQLKTSTYGMPFSGNALVMAYRPSVIENPPKNLENAISLSEALLFPASDPQALFTLCMYLATGESLQDAEGRPSLDKDTLVNILDHYQRASQAGVMPYWITQYSTDGQVWEAFGVEPYPMSVTWASYIIQNKPDDLSLVPLPTLDGSPFTLATGWSWALAGVNQERRELGARLAEYLVDKEFLASWTQVAGYLPPLVDALRSWEDTPMRKMVEQISYSAQLVPSADLIATIGPSVEQAVVDVLKAQNSPEDAAQAVIDKVNKP